MHTCNCTRIVQRERLKSSLHSSEVPLGNLASATALTEYRNAMVTCQITSGVELSHNHNRLYFELVT